VNAAGEIPHVVKPRFIQQLHSLSATRAHFANCNDVLSWVEFLHSARQFGERDKIVDPEKPTKHL
jgi:hypothetical protein